MSRLTKGSVHGKLRDSRRNQQTFSTLSAPWTEEWFYYLQSVKEKSLVFTSKIERLNVLFLFSYSSCCWISLANGGNGNWFLSTTVNLTRRQDNGKINSSPISALSPIVRHQQGCSKTLVIPAEDSDGDKVRCRWSTGSHRECGAVCQRFSSSGTLDEVSQRRQTWSIPANF